MQPALAAIWLSVVLGAALGVWQRLAPRVTEPIRTFAVVAAALVVSLSLMPHALQSEGLGGLLGAVAGYLAIPALERLGMALFRQGDPHALRLELGYGGLLLHRFGDGVTMSVEGHGHGVLWALGAHEVPIVALVTLAFIPRGLSLALARAVGLGLSSSVGYFLVSALPAATWHALHGWADALAAGVLIHIVVHEGLRLHAQPHLAEALPQPSRSLPQRMLDLGAALLACGLIAALSLDHDSGALELLRHMLALALQLSPWLCLGLLLRAAALSRLARGPVGLAARSMDPVLLGCSLALLGAQFVAAQLVLGLLLAVVLLPLRATAPGADGGSAAQLPDRAPSPAFGAVLERELVPLVGWLLLGVLAAAYARAHVAPMPGGGTVLTRLAWAAAIAALASGSVPAAVPMAAALVTLGFPPAAALAGLLLGIAVPPLLGRWRSPGASRRTARFALLLLLLAGAALAAPARLPLLSSFHVGPAVALASVLSWLSLAALLGFVGRNIWQTGVREWLVTSLASSLWPGSSHGHEHASPGRS